MALSSESNPNLQAVLVCVVGGGKNHVAHPKSPSRPVCGRQLEAHVSSGRTLDMAELSRNDRFLCADCCVWWNDKVRAAKFLESALPAKKGDLAGVWVTRPDHPGTTHIAPPQASKNAICGQSLFGPVTFGGILARAEVSDVAPNCKGCVAEWNRRVEEDRQLRAKQKAEEEARIKEERERAEEEAAADERVQSVLNWPVRKAERAKVLAVLWNMVSDCPGDPSILSWATELEERINDMDYR